MAEKDTKTTNKSKASKPTDSEATKTTSTKKSASKDTSASAPKATGSKTKATKPTAESSKATSTAKTATANETKPSATAKSSATEKASASKAETTSKKSSSKPAETEAKSAKTSKKSEAVSSAKTKETKPETKTEKKSDKTDKKDADTKKTKSGGKSEKVNSSKNSDKKYIKSGKGSGASAIALNPKQLRTIIISSVSVLLVIAIILGVVLGTKSCNTDNFPFVPFDPTSYDYDRFDDNTNFTMTGLDDSAWEGELATAITGGFEKGSSRAPQTADYLGVVDAIIKPLPNVVLDEHETYGVKVYPSYGKNLKGYTVEERNGLIKEGHALAPSPTWKSLGIYNGIDSEGYLLKNGQRVLYSSNVGSGSDNEEAEGEIISGGIEDEGGEELESGSTTANSQYNYTYRMLYKHTAAEAMYGGGLSDSEPRIIKQISFINHTKVDSTQITGLYAPAGEVIKIEMSKSDYYAAGGLIVVIGQTYNLSQHVSMETSGNGIKGSGLSRMPDIVSRFQLNDAGKNVTIEGDKVTAYVGSFLGGPIYIRPIRNDKGAEKLLTVTISGGVKYQHFILGSTTEEEYNDNKASTAPYFDLEVYDAVRFTTHKYASSGGKALRNFTYEDCTDAAILWDKISQVSKRVAQNGLSSASSPVYIIGDCYIAAGAAFANPGRNGVVCPPSWLAGALNYSKFVNGGEWGTMHEYNHCWQGYGLGNGGEVSNNATTLVAYSLYTRISQGRTMTGGLSGWSRYTDPAWAMTLALPTTAKGNKIFDLSAYATLLHNIGQDNFVQSARGGREAGSTVYFNQLVNATHYDMTYFFTKVLNFNIGGETKSKGSITQAAVDAVKAKNYPMFVPVSSVYQVGRSIIYDNEKQYIITAQPFSYGYGEFTMDFNNHNGNGTYSNKNLVIPNGFTVSVVGVTQPANGRVELLENNYVKYTPASGKEGLYSGNFRVKLRIIKDDGEFGVEDVDLVINLKQSSAGTQLQRTTYVYDLAESVPDTASILNGQTFNFGSYTSTEIKNNVCAMETNTQIWAAGRNYDDAVYNDKSKNYRVMPVNQTLQMLEGTMYFSSEGTYRITLKGRGKATLYLSYNNGETWENALTIERTSGNAYDQNQFTTHEFTTQDNYVQFKVVLLVTKESDFFGIGVSKQKADGTFPAFENASAILNADIHKALSELSQQKFTTEYRFKTEYKYAYAANYDASDQTLVSVSHDSWANADRGIANLFDGKTNTYYHTLAGEANYITAEKPFELVADLGAVRGVNRVTFNFYNNTVNNNGQPRTFKLYGGLDKNCTELLVEKTDQAYSNIKPVTFTFTDTQIQYYKLVVTDTDNHRYFAMASIVFGVSYSNGKIVAPHDELVRYIGNGWTAENAFSNFGVLYTANAGDSVEFHFDGKRFAYLASKSDAYGTVDIYIDGKLVAENVSLSAGAGSSGMQVSEALSNYFNERINTSAGTVAYMYAGSELSDGYHVAKIVGKSGKFNVDSFAYWG